MNVVKRIGKQTLCIMLSMMMVWSLIPGLSYSLVYAEDGGAAAQSQAVEESVDKSDEASEAEAPAEAAAEAEAEEEKAEAKEEKESPKAEEPAAEPKEAAEVESKKDSGDKPKDEASEDVSEDTEEADENVSEETEEVGAYGGKYSKDLEKVAVEVETTEGAFEEEVELVVKPLDEDSDEYADAEKALKKNKQTYGGMLAFDIHFENADGKEIEPSGPVSVTMNAKKEALKDISVDAFDAESVQITHIGEKATEIVADTADETDGTVDVNVGTKAVKSIESTFEVENFSTFTLTWGTGSATIHFVDSGTGEELDSDTLTFDTTASSFSIATDFSGYYYSGATYCTAGQSEEQGITMESVLHKNADGTWSLTHVDTEENTTSEVTVANGSDIYAYYYKPGSPNPSGADDSTIPSPTTEKTVTNNGDGTYTVQLDITGATLTQDNSHYVNVLVVLDATRSMNGSKWTNAKAAMKTLVETLCEGENAANAGKIDFALVTFGRAATVTQNWTKDNAAFKTACANVGMVSTSGTNWEAGMRGALYGVLNNKPDDDPTYVIFLTDGDPNVYYSSGSDTNYTNTGTTNGWNQNANTSATHSADEAKTIAASNKLYGIYCGDSGTTPSGDSYNRLVSVITGTGQGGQKTIAANADTIESEFQAIAETALKDIGASNASVDDGVPQMASVSSQVVEGDVSGYEYYIKKKGDADFSVWTDAPGASFNDENGVTWDLTDVGTLEAETTYRVKFTVWPSQAAYDLIADLNNGVVDYDDLTAAQKAQIGGNKTSGYYMVTNTHLKTTYTVSDTEYTDDNDYEEQDMPLPTETISVKKIWNNPYDPDVHNGGASVDLFLTKDGKDYLTGDNAIHVTAVGKDGVLDTDDDWISTEDIYVSCGLISQPTAGGAYVIKESGHDYSVSEPEEFAFHWDLKADVYRPMTINGTTTKILVLDDDATGTDGTDYYVIDGHKYRVTKEGEDHLIATNDRRSNLNLTKVVNDLSQDKSADPDELFTYTCNFDTADGEEVYFSAWANNAYQEIEGTGITKEIGTDGEWTGYYYAPAKTNFTIKIKAGWNIRFINLPMTTTYSIEEGDMGVGYTFVSAEGEGWNYTTKKEDDYSIDVTGQKVEGSIPESNHSYTVTVTNKYEPSGVELTVQKNWSSTLNITTHGDIKVALFKDANGDGKVTSDEYIEGSLKTISSGSTSVTYDKLSSLEGLIVREVTVTTEGDKTTVTPVDAGGTIAVTGETVSGKEGTYSNTYTAAYEQGTAEDNARTDTITNTLDVKKIVRDVSFTIKKVDGATSGTTGLEGAVFTLTNTTTHEETTYTTGSGGTVTITFSGYETTENVNQSKSTTYTLKETTAPNGYTANDTEYTVTVSENQVSVTQNTETNAWEWLYNLILSILGKDGTASSDFVNGVLTVTNPPTTQEISVEKVWKDTDSTKRPGEISVTLLADGEPVSQTGITATQKLSSSNQWKYTWTGLYTTKDGKDIAYTVKEDVAIDGYATAYSGSETAGFTITNSNVTLDTKTKFFKKTVPQGSESKQSAATFNFTAVQVADENGTAMESGTAWTNSQSVDYAKGEYGTKQVDFGTITYNTAGTYYYKVTEAAPPDGWSATPTSREVIVTVTVSGSAADGFTVSVDDKEITNKYSVEKTDITLSASKKLEVESGNNPPDVSEQYTLTLKDSTGKVLSTKKNPDGKGTAVDFDKIEYTEPGTYTYTVEESGTVTGVTNGTTSYTVTVTVTDNGDGTMTAAVTSGSQTTAFTNTYKVTPTEARFPVKKVLEVPEGLTPDSIAGKFTFTLTAVDGTPMPTVTSYTNPTADGGTVSFGDITYSAPGTYTYTVTESGSADGVTNDTTLAKTVTVTVVDNGNGTLTATATSTTENPLTFTNKYNVEPTDITLGASKTLKVESGDNAPDVSGKYTLTLKDNDGNQISQKINPDGNGTAVEFDKITYTAPGTYTYTVEESGTVAGVTNGTSSYEVIVTVTDNGDGTLTAAVTKGDQTTAFTNTYKVGSTTVDFPVKKVLEVPEGLTPDSIKGKFTFTLTAADGTPMPETTSYTNPDDNGGTVTFGDITYSAPGTYTYTVKETGSADGVTNDKDAEKTVTVTVVDNGNGTLTATATSTEDNPLTFTNTYSVEPTKASFPVEKILEVEEGLTPPDITEKYTFELTAADGTPMPKTTSYKNPDKDGGTVTFGEIEYTAPGTYTYTVTESGTVAGVANDAAAEAGKTVTVTVVDNGDGTLTATPSVNDNSPLQFTNTYSVDKVGATIPVVKILEVEDGLTAPDITKAYTFTLEAVDGAPLVDLDGNEIETELQNPSATGGSMTFGTIAFTKPGTYKYKITEAGEVDGVKNDSEATKEITIVVTDKSDGTMSVVVNGGKEVEFTNTYEVEPTTVSFPAKKVLEVPEGLTPDSIKGKFTFTLTAADGTPMPTVTSYTNPDDDGGTVTFGTISYTKPGTYEYTVTETGSADGVTNDETTAKTVTVTVVDNSDGTMTATADSTDKNPLTFTNKYDVEPTKASFPVEKILEVPEGLTPASIKDKFTFALTAEDGTPMPQTTSYTNPTATGGTVTFGEIEYTAPGTYTYTVTETGEVEGVTNDSKAEAGKTVTVTVVDNGDGTLTATPSVTTEEPLTFTNKYDVKPTKASFPVEKILEVEEGLKAPDITEKYTFELTAADGTPMPKTTSYKNPDKDGGTVTFGEIEYTAPGTYTYTVTETGEVKGIANDSAAEAGKTVTVTVVDNGDGTLTATPSVNEDSPLQFTNTYSVDKVGATIPVVKILEVPEGLTAPDITEAYTFTLEAVDGAPLVDLDGNAVTTEKKNPTATGGSVTFGTIAFSKPGTYKYKVTEAGTVPGITNDQQATKEVEIVVTDNSDGTMTAVVNDGKEVEFTNAYSVEPTTSKAKVKKTVTAVDPAAESTTFSFELEAGTNTSAGGVDTPMPEKTKVEATFTEAGDLDVYFDEVEFKEPGVYNYTITEDVDSLPGGWVVDGSPAEITITVTDNSDGTLTAVVSNATITNEYPTKKVEGVKNWNDADYFDEDGNPLNGYERKDITIKLLADGEETGKTVTLKAEDFKDLDPADPWPFSFTDLPATADHGETEIVYTVVEVTPEGWTSEVDEYEVINTPVEKEEVLNPTDLTIKKVDATTETGNGLEGAVFTLFDAEGVGVGSYTTNDKGEVVIPFTQTGNSIGTYTLKETQTPTGYEPITDEYKVVVEKDFIEVTFNKEKTVWQWIYDLIFGEESDFDTKTRILTVPNTPKKTEVTATKIWNDASDKDGVRPDEVTFQLYKTVNGVESIMEGKTITLSGDADTWTDKITDLWEYEDGYKIKYTFKELDADGNVVADGGILPGKDGAEYTAAYNEDGVTIRNSHQVSPDKDVTKAGVTIDGQPVQGGDTLTYTITYINTSGKTAEEVVIKDTPPTYTKFVTGSNKVVEGPAAESFDAGDELVWTFKEVADGTTITVSFDVKVDKTDAAGQTLVNKASVNGKDTNEVINSVPKKEVFDTKTDTFIDGEAVKIGQVLTYKIYYKNVTGEAEKVTITDKIPDLTEYVANSADHDGVESDGTITWELNLDKDEDVTVTFQVKVSDDVNGEILENTATVKDAENDFSVDTNTTENPTPRKLKIIKNLADFVDHGENVDATFAFEIKGKDEAGNEVYTNTIGMDFTGGKTTEEVIVKGIPSKAVTVTVEEVYSGNYTPAETGAVKVSEVDGVYQVTFNNTKSDIEYKGGVTNHYAKDGDTYKYQPEQVLQ